MYSYTSRIGPILSKVAEGEALDGHEKAVLNYLSLVLADFGIETNSQLETKLEDWRRHNATL